jgi:hypothetical protein
MRRSEVLEGVWMLRFRSVFDRWESSELSQPEAVELLGIGERTFRRRCARYRDAGDAGLQDRRAGSGGRQPCACVGGGPVGSPVS